MRRSVMAILTLSALAAVTPGISGLQAATPVQAASGSLLEYIPADTPYVFTNLEPLPESVLAKIRNSTGSFWEAYREIMRAAIEEEAKKAKEKGEEVDPRLTEMADFFMDYLSWDGLESLGVGFKGHMAIYGVSLLPVVRWELEDPDAFRAALARFEERLGKSAPTGNLEGQDYWTLKNKDIGLYYAVAGNSLVAGLLPPQLEADLLPAVLGLKKPSNSLAQSRRLHQIAAANHYLPYGVGYVDIQRLAEIFLGATSDEYTKLLQTLGPGKVEMDEVCEKETLQLAQTWPLFQAGYTDMTTERMGFKGVLQASPELARRLKGLVNQVPGIGAADDGIFSLGISLNLTALRSFVASQAESFRNNPYQCKQLSELGGAFDQLDISFSQAPPPLFELGLRGIRTVAKSFDFDPQVSELRDLKSYTIVHLDDPLAAFQMLQEMAPPFADLNLEPNGEPVALPEGLLPPTMSAPMLVMTQDALALSIGEGSLESLQAALGAETLQPTPLLSIGYRLSAFMPFVKQQLEAQAAQSDDPAKASEIEQIASILGLYDYIKKLVINFSFTDEGVVLTEAIELN